MFYYPYLLDNTNRPALVNKQILKMSCPILNINVVLIVTLLLHRFWKKKKVLDKNVKVGSQGRQFMDE